MKAYNWRRVRAKGFCAKGSIRTIPMGMLGKIMRVCCPKGKWSPRSRRCSVGTRAYEIGTPK